MLVLLLLLVVSVMLWFAGLSLIQVDRMIFGGVFISMGFIAFIAFAGLLVQWIMVQGAPGA